VHGVSLTRISNTFYIVGFHTVDFYTVKIYTIIFYTVAKFIRSFFIRSKFIPVKIYTGQNLYGSKFIRVKIYTVKIYTLYIMEAHSHCIHCQAVLWRSHVKFEQLHNYSINQELESSEPEPIRRRLWQLLRSPPSSDCTTLSWTYCWTLLDCNEGILEAGGFYCKNWKISPWSKHDKPCPH
jgi:hypothetical protein